MSTKSKNTWVRVAIIVAGFVIWALCLPDKSEQARKDLEVQRARMLKEAFGDDVLKAQRAMDERERQRLNATTQPQK